MFVLKSVLTVFGLLAAVHAAPISSRDDSVDDTITLFDTSGLIHPAHFARAAYCDSAFVANLTCGDACAALGDVEILVTGGDNKQNPAFYVAHDKDNQQIVVAHQGTNTANL